MRQISFFALLLCVGLSVASESPQELLSRFAAVPVPAKADYQVLLDERTVSFDGVGGYRVASHSVIRVLTADGVDSWSFLNASWQPWRESRPEIRARVIRSSGEESMLASSAVVEGNQQGSEYNLRSDTRRLSAPMPNLEPGAVLEFWLLERGTEARPGSGYGQASFAGGRGPVERRVVVIEAPASLPLTWSATGTTKPSVSRESFGDAVRVTFEYPRVDAVARAEPLLPPDVPPSPILFFGTAPSWRRVAEVYDQAVDPLLDPDSVRPWALDAVRGVDPKADALGAVRAVAERIRQSVRYTGINFGENSIIPHAPAETLKAGYGDCKDQAALFVSCLRALGIDARLALLKAGSGLDVDPQVPALEFFNHAIVRVPALDLWIDPTAVYAPVGSLPESDQGRRALVVAPGTAALQRLPKGGPSENWSRKSISIELSETGKAARVRERFTVGGLLDQRYRAHFNDSSRAARVEYLEKYGVAHYDAAQATATFSDPFDLDVPFSLEVSASKSGNGGTDNESANFIMRAGDLFSFLPSELELSAEKPTPRTEAVYLTLPHVNVLEYSVRAPSGYRAKALPSDYVLDLGPASIAARFSSPEPTLIEAVYTLTLDSDRFSAEELGTFRAESREFLESKAQVAAFESIGYALIQAGHHREALAEYRRLQALHPSEALHRIQASDVLREACFTEDAISEAEAAVALEPDSAAAHRNLAFICLNDPFGRQFGPGADLDRASAEYLKAYELDPSDYRCLFNYGIIREFGSDGTFRGPGARLAEAAAAFERAADKIESFGHAERYLGDLFFLGRYSDALKASAKLKDRRAGARYAIASTAALSGSGAAERLASDIVPNVSDRRAALKFAAIDLIAARRYVPAADLLAASARGTSAYASTADGARMIRNVKPKESREPRSGADALVVDLFDSLLTEERLDPELFVPSLRGAVMVQSAESAFGAARRRLRNSMAEAGFSRESVGDVIAEYLTVKTARSGAVSLGSVSLPALGEQGVLEIAYAEAGDRAYLVEAGGTEGVGEHILALAGAGKFAEAGEWATVFRNPSGILEGYSAGPSDSLAALMPKNPSTPEQIILAGSLLCSGTRSAALASRALPPVSAAAAAEQDPKRKTELTRLALRLAGTAKADAARGAARDYLSSAADKADAASAAVSALREAGFLDEAVSVAREALGRFPNDLGLRRNFLYALQQSGRHAEAITGFRELIDSELGTSAGDVNNAAWALLFAERPDFGIIEEWSLTRRIGNDGPSSLHTLACVFGASGRYDEALSAYRKYIESDASRTVDDALWLVHGMLARSFGLPDRAVRSFDRAVQTGDLADPTSSASLARVWRDRP